MPIAILLQTLSRTFLWIFLISIDIVVPLILSFSSQGHWVYVTLAALAVLAFLYTYFFEEDGVLRDIREICLYDVFVHSLALGLYLSGNRTDLIHIALMDAVALLKYARLVWPTKNANGDDFAAWPVFGILGWLNRHSVSNEEDSKPTRRQALAVYGLLLICLLVGCLISYSSFELKLAYFCILPLLILPSLYKRTRAEIIEQDARYREAVKATSKAESLAEAAQIIALEKEKMNAELAEINAELKEAHAHAERVSCALRDVGHDLRSPIHVLGFATLDVIKARDDASREVALHDFFTANEDLLTTMDNSLHYAKLATRMSRPKIRAIDLGKLLQGMCAQLRNVARENGIGEMRIVSLAQPRNQIRNQNNNLLANVSIENTSSGPFVASDEGLLLRIVRNLLVNAIRHASPCKRITLSMRRRGAFILLQVWDQGAGIADVDGYDGAGNFLAFAQRVYKEVPDGDLDHNTHGMGINIVRQLGDIAQFEVSLRSHVGHGTVFGVMLPLADAKLIALSLAERAEHQEKIVHAAFLQRYLHAEGAEVAEAGDVGGRK